jgi:RNA polymerase sigma-70 factor (ECF subfamily)
VDSRRERFERVAPALIEPVRRYLARRTDPATADDVLADTLLVCWRHAEELGDHSLPWVYGVARMCLRNAERSARRQQRLGARLAAVDPPPTTAPGPGESDGEGGRADAAVTEALAGLRPEDAELLRLWAWEQLTPAEIATVLGISVNAAHSRLHRARRRLGERLRKDPAGAGHEESTEGSRP